MEELANFTNLHRRSTGTVKLENLLGKTLDESLFFEYIEVLIDLKE